jgi:hypothetical protein
MEAPRQIEVRPEAKELELGLTPERMGRAARRIVDSRSQI